MRTALEILIPVWVIGSVPVAVLIGRHLRRRSSPDLPPLTGRQVDRVLRMHEDGNR